VGKVGLERSKMKKIDVRRDLRNMDVREMDVR
jgi:hypothetical protein